MELKDLKAVVSFARKAGVKSLSFNGVQVEFKDEIIVTQPRKTKAKTAELSGKEEKSDSIPKVPTLDEINKFIYGPDTSQEQQ